MVMEKYRAQTNDCHDHFLGRWHPVMQALHEVSELTYHARQVINGFYLFGIIFWLA